MDIDRIVRTLECLVWLGFMVAMIIVALRKRQQPEQNGAGQPPPADNLDRPHRKSDYGDTLYTLTAIGLIGCGTVIAILFLFGGGALGFYCGLPAVFLAFAGVIMLLNKSNNPTSDL